MGLEEEIRELEKRFSEAPDSRLFLPLADALRRAGELERAVKLCREGLERFPDFASASILLGECLAELGDLEQAEQTLEKMAAEDSDNLRVLKRLAGLAERKGDKDKAQALYEQLGQQEAVEAESYAAPEQPEGGTGALEPVEDDRAVAMEQDPGELFITHTLADIYRLQGHYEQAYEIYNKLIESQQEDPELKRKLEEVTSHLGGEPEAEPDAGGIQAENEEERDGLKNRFEERIDRIFRFLLGDECGSSIETKSGKRTTESPGGTDQFVEILESWITDLRESEL
jgi:tetratricopeptide (TPR) repeat protein